MRFTSRIFEAGTGLDYGLANRICPMLETPHPQTETPPTSAPMPSDSRSVGLGVAESTTVGRHSLTRRGSPNKGVWPGDPSRMRGTASDSAHRRRSGKAPGRRAGGTRCGPAGRHGCPAGPVGAPQGAPTIACLSQPRAGLRPHTSVLVLMQNCPGIHGRRALGTNKEGSQRAGEYVLGVA